MNDTVQIQTKKETLLSAMKAIIPFGFRCLTTSRGDWGYIITPNDNVLFIQSVQNMGDWRFSLCYRPTYTKKEMSQCYERLATELTPDVITQTEQSGIEFTRRFGTLVTQNAVEWRKKCWEADSLEDVNL